MTEYVSDVMRLALVSASLLFLRCLQSSIAMMLRAHQRCCPSVMLSANIKHVHRALHLYFRLCCQHSQRCTSAAVIATSAAATPSEQQQAPQTAADRKPKRKPQAAAAQPTKVLQAAAAASTGPLPEVLAATFPETFATLSAARRGAGGDS